MSKLFECVIASEVCSKSEYDKYQFGFKGSHSTGLCTSIFKKTVDYYTCRGSYVFTCSIDFTKAFDRINYWKLFCKLSVLLLYWHIAILISLSVYGGLILYQIASTREIAPDKVVCFHLTFSIVISGIS